MSLYDIIIPADHLHRKINELMDFSFVYQELKDKYCENLGRTAVHPIAMFKYLLLKYIYNLSDRGVVERSRYDMSFKYFLDLQPEDQVIDASSLTKFRKQRLKDICILDLLIQKSVELALKEGVIKNPHAIIIDATHTDSKYQRLRRGKMYARQIEHIESAVKVTKIPCTIPEKPKDYRYKAEETRAYGREFITALRENTVCQLPQIKEDIELLEEMLDDEIDAYDRSPDNEARVGHKSPTKSFYGYKTHLAMTEDRIITAATITSGEKTDGKELKELVEKSRKNGLSVEEVIGDCAYSTINNLLYLKGEKNGSGESEGIRLVAPARPAMKIGQRQAEKGFEYNKDAGMMQCPQGYLAKKKHFERRTTNYKNNGYKYTFDIENCKKCPKREGCYKEGQKIKQCRVGVKKDFYKLQEDFQKSEYFKKRYQIRYMIEAKNGELKNRHGYETCEMKGIRGLELQGAVTIFVVNLKRILKLKGESLPQIQEMEEE